MKLTLNHKKLTFRHLKFLTVAELEEIQECLSTIKTNAIIRELWTPKLEDIKNTAGYINRIWDDKDKKGKKGSVIHIK